MRAKQMAIATFVALALIVPAAQAQAPKAKKIVLSLTEPSAGSLATIRLDKKGLVKMKALPGNVQFQLKLSGVLDGADQPVSNINNTFQVDIVVGGVFSTENFIFDLVDGKVSQKFIVTNAALGVGGSAGDPVEIRRVRVLQSGSGNEFATGGLTLN